MQLPTLSRVKFEAMMQKEQDSRDAASAVSRRLSDVSRSLATAPASEYASIEKERERLLIRQSDLAAKHRNLADLNAALGNFIARATEPLEFVKTPKVPLQKGETISAAIIRLRERIAALSAERVKVMQARLPAADLKVAAAAYVDALAERGGPRIIADHSRNFEVQFPVGETWEDKGLAAKLPAILAWLNAEQFLVRLNQSIDAMPPPQFAMSAKARAERLIALEAELLQCEREEEALIEACEEGEGPVVALRRLTADPRAVLGLGTIQSKAVKPEGKVQRLKAGAA